MRRRVVGRLRTAKTIKRGRRRDLAPIGQRCAADISRRDIREILDTIAERAAGAKRKSASRWSAPCFRWGLAQDFIAANPAVGFEPYDPGVPRDRVLTVEEIELVWKWLESDSLSLEAADILKLELLLGARCGEIAGLHTVEVDRQKWIWTLPASRSKNGRQRVTPIVGLAREILEQRLFVVEKGPLFVLENGTVLTSSHVGHAERQAKCAPLGVGKRMGFSRYLSPGLRAHDSPISTFLLKL